MAIRSTATLSSTPAKHAHRTGRFDRRGGFPALRWQDRQQRAPSEEKGKGASHGVSCTGRDFPRRRRGRGPAGAAGRAGFGPGLSAGWRHRRALGAGRGPGRTGGPSLRGVRRRSSALRHRPRTSAAPPLGDAPGGVRAGRRTVRADRSGTRRPRPRVRPAARERRGRGTRAGALVDGLRLASTRGAQRAHDPPRPAVVLDPAAAGPRSDPDPGLPAPAGAGVRQRRGRAPLARRRQGGRDDCARRFRRPLPPALRPAPCGAVWHA